MSTLASNRWGNTVINQGCLIPVSLEDDKVDVAFKAIADTKWECVALLNSDKGIPKTAKDRLDVFADLMVKVKRNTILIRQECTSIH